MLIEPAHLYRSSILIIDDQQINLDVIAETLESAGFEKIVKILQPLELNNILKNMQFDLVFLDINMPFFDGFAALSLIKTRFSEINRPPVIMLTAQADEPSRIKALESGASDFISKPFNRIELLKRANIHLENFHAKKLLTAKNKILDQKVKERTQELEATKLEMIYRLGRAVEYRDNETGNHVKRISQISKIIARQSGQNEDYCELIKMASPMHDIGKIAIADDILNKSDKLNAEEYSLIKAHVTIGAEILQNGHSRLLQMAHEIALSHHEKYDGSGYPDGLNGQQIPLSGRIVAIADVFDTLISERPYKQAWQTKRAVQHLLEQKGKHFDPNLVDAFIQALPEIESILERYKD